MVCYIILKGEKIDNLKIPSETYIIVADGAFNYCKDYKITPDLIVGDFDSYSVIPENALIYPADKNLTDGEIALNKAIEVGATEIVFVCFGGLRDDHFLCNLNLLEIAYEKGICATALTNYSEIMFVKQNKSFQIEIGSIISLIAIEDSVIKKSNGLKYKYNNTPLNRASTLGISNIAISENIEVEVQSGSIYLIINKTT